MSILIHPTYFPSIAHWVIIANHQGSVVIEAHDNYQKQTYRNRTYIYSPNGKQLLSVPIRHTKDTGRQKYSDVVIEDSFDWKKQHWKSIETAYRTSPYFEFYEDDLKPFFEKKHTTLFDMNLESMELLADCMQLEQFSYELTTNFQTNPSEAQDKRNLVIAKNQRDYHLEPYIQVFDDKHGYLNNLSALDLLFNQGPNALDYLLNATIEDTL